MPRNSQLVRVIKVLYKLLTTKWGITIKELADLCSVHPKTIRRDLRAIKNSDFTLIVDQDNDHKKYLVREQLYYPLTDEKEG